MNKEATLYISGSVVISISMGTLLSTPMGFLTLGTFLILGATISYLNPKK